jgi:N-acetyl-alpha-D-glucosaminyl L-malate synthase BshA
LTDAPLRIGITCYPTFGGSGVVATEIGQELARRGHRVHFICQDIPTRLDRFADNIVFHAVEPPSYPLFQHQPYALALASRMVEVADYEGLDLLHVHYAVPHATSAYLARQILAERAPKVVTTLHGTDITLVGNDASYLPITRFSIEQSDALTAPSQYLVEATHRELGIDSRLPIDVIPNFVDTERFCPDRSVRAHCLARLFPDARAETALAVHVSNFRAVKRLDLLVAAFECLARENDARLVLVGDGPERSRVQALVRGHGLAERVRFLGNREDFVEVLQAADVFLQASDSESFGLASLEAQACGVPVVATRVGGVAEVIEDGVTGLLTEAGNAEALATAAARVLAVPEDWREMSEAARRRATASFSMPAVLDRYERCYRDCLGS